MEWLVKTVFFIGLFAFSIEAVKDDSTLLAVAQIYRHGERSPLEFYTNDPYADAQFWEDLDGQLTNKGKRQHFTLGNITRSRYYDFVPERYNKDFIRAVTTDVDRNYMSGECNLYGLFPAQNDQVWQRTTDWQPIPLRTADPKVLNGYPFECPFYDELVAALWDSEEYVAIDQQYQELYEYLSNYTGDNITTVRDVLTTHDCLLIEDGVGYDLPEWTKQVYPEPLRTVAGIGYQSLSATRAMQQLYVGTLLNEIVELFSGISDSTSNTLRYLMYSAHDSNVASILNTFGAYDPPFPVYFASSIWIELRIASGERYVNIYFRDTDEVSQITLQGCGADCPLSTFKTILADVLLDVNSYTEKCLTNNLDTTHNFTKFQNFFKHK